MHIRRVLLLLTVASLLPASLPAQSFNLRDLLTNFFKAGITLAEPPPGSPFPSHAHHFIGDASLVPLTQLNNELAIQLSTFPLASSAGGFSYRYDPALGTFTRASDSFGPIYTERADTNGKGRFNVGLNFSHFSFSKIDDLSLRDGDIQIVLKHQQLSPATYPFIPFFQGDVITTQTFLKIQSDITALAMSYGVTDRLDIGAAVPIVRVQIQAQTNATIDKLATGGNPNTVGIHQFVGGGDTATFQQSGSASGIGDIVLRAKYRILSDNLVGLAVAAEGRLPTGEQRDLLGTGTTQIKGFLVGSARLGTFSPHINAGYTWSSRRETIPDEINYAAGFDLALHPRFTVVIDALGRTFRNSQILRELETVFQYNTNVSNTPIDIHSTTLKQLVATQEDATSFVGSVGARINPVGNLLFTVNGLFNLNERGLQYKFAPLVAMDYSF